MTQSETQSALSPEFQALLVRVNEIGKSNHDALVAENRKMIADAIGQVASAGVSPVAGAAPQLQATPSMAPKSENLLAKIGLANPWSPVTVQVTKAQALSSLAMNEPSPTVRAIAQRGLDALGIEMAYEMGMVQAPKKGLETWQAVAIGIAGTAVVAGGIAGAMYVGEVGPFAAK